MKEIPEKFKAYRLANRMTLKQLAASAGCTDAYLSIQALSRMVG